MEVVSICKTGYGYAIGNKQLSCSLSLPGYFQLGGTYPWWKRSSSGKIITVLGRVVLRHRQL